MCCLSLMKFQTNKLWNCNEIPCSAFSDHCIETLWIRTQLESDHLLKGLLNRCTWSGEVCALLSTLNTNSTKVKTVKYEKKRKSELFTYVMQIYGLVYLSWGGIKRGVLPSHFFWKTFKSFFFFFHKCVFVCIFWLLLFRVNLCQVHAPISLHAGNPAKYSSRSCRFFTY